MVANTTASPAPSAGPCSRAVGALAATTPAAHAPTAARHARRSGRGASTAPGERDHEAGREHGRAPHARRVVAARLGAVEAVAPVLAPERLERVARRVERAQLRDADDPAAPLEEPRRQLGVLVDGPAVVPAAVLVERLALPDAREDAGVDVLLLLGLPLARAARAEPGAQRDRHPPRPLARPVRDLRAGDPFDVAALEALDALRHVLGRVVGVRVHAHDVVPARVLEPDVEAEGRAPLRVVEHPDAMVGGRHLLEDLLRAVLRVAVHEEELDLAVVALREHRLDALADVPLLVEDRDQHADVYFSVSTDCCGANVTGGLSAATPVEPKGLKGRSRTRLSENGTEASFEESSARPQRALARAPQASRGISRVESLRSRFTRLHLPRRERSIATFARARRPAPGPTPRRAGGSERHEREAEGLQRARLRLVARDVGLAAEPQPRLHGPGRRAVAEAIPDEQATRPRSTSGRAPRTPSARAGASGTPCGSAGAVSQPNSVTQKRTGHARGDRAPGAPPSSGGAGAAACRPARCCRGARPCGSDRPRCRGGG